MKKLNSLQGTNLIIVCSENTFRIIKLVILLFMVTVINVLGSNPLNSTLSPDKATSPAAIMQQNRITGTVTDEKGNPLPGVNIQVEGTIQGAISDISGKYSIESRNENAVLVFTFIGYDVQKVPVSGRTIIDIKMVPTLTSLEEVVVVGYGAQKKGNLIGSISSVRSEKLTSIPTQTITQAIMGKASGIFIKNTNGQLGDLKGIEFSIRGFGEPLIIIDGVHGTKEEFSQLDHSNIEEFNILKDAASSVLTN